MRKLYIIFSIFLVLALTTETFSQAKPYKILWNKRATNGTFFANDGNTRSIAFNPVTNHLLVPSRTVASNVIIMDPVTGDSIGKLDMTGITGGTYLINMIRITPDGKIYVCNLTTGPGSPFKIYRWDSETALPTVAYSGTLGLRVGDSFGLSGAGANTIIYASGSSSTKIYRFTTTDGLAFTAYDTVTVATGIARGGISPITTGLNSDLWVDGSGTSTYHISSTGTIIDTVNGGYLSSGWHNVVYFAPNTGRKYILSVGKNDTQEGSRVRMSDITTSEKWPTIWADLIPDSPYVANTNATGDVAVVDNLDGTFNVYGLVSNNNITAYQTNMLTIAQAREDLNNDLIPDRLNDTVTVVGVVISPNYQTSNRSYYINDETGGIATFSPGLITNPVMNLGDKYRIKGKILHYNGLTEISTFDSTSFFFISDSNAVPAPIQLTLAEYKANAEMYEAKLVEIDNLNKLSGTWPAAGSSATLKMIQGSSLADTVELRIDSDTDIDGQPEPLWPQKIIAVGSQFITYQLLPRFYGFDFLITPVELTSFTVKASSDKVTLNWLTASEINNSGFQVERSLDNRTFTSLGFVKGNGTTTEKNSYSFVDNNVQAGKEYYYRLKQVDFDGSYNYSKVVNVNTTMPKVYNLAQNYPNPFNPSTTINFSLPVDARVSIKIYNVLGKEVYSAVNDNLTAGSHSVNVNLMNISTGVYFYNLEAKGVDGSIFTSTKKMTLMK